MGRGGRRLSCNGDLFKESYAWFGGVGGLIPADLHIPGCPPRPVELLKGLLALLECNAT